MHRVLVAVALASLASLAPAVLGAAPPAQQAPHDGALPRVERSVPFKPGETLTYDVTWSTYLTAGTAVMTVKEKRPSFDSTAYYIVAEARPTPMLSKLYTLYYKMDTLLDSVSLLPQRGSIYSEEGSRRRYRITRFDHAARKATYERRADSIATSDFAVPPLVQDGLSALYVARALSFKPGDRMIMPVSDNGSNFRIQFDVGPPERVNAPIGQRTAWKVRLAVLDENNKTVGRNMAFWISDDARKLPLKFQAELTVGSFVLLLRQAT